MQSDNHETINLINEQPEIADALRQTYLQWTTEMLRQDDFVEIEAPFQNRYDNYLPAN